MPSSRYPKEEEARATFTDEEFDSAANMRRGFVPLVKFETHNNPELVLNARILTRIADLIDDLPFQCHLMGNEIVRAETRQEAEFHVIHSRQYEMHYQESSPFYAIHAKNDDAADE